MIRTNTCFTLATGNLDKIKEFERLLGYEIDGEKVDLPEIQAIDITEVSKSKVGVAYGELRRPVLVDDTGLFIDAWNGLPGALVKWFLDSVGEAGIIRMMEGETNRSAKVMTSLAYKDSTHEFTVIGEVKGMIADRPKGENGFGYDSIFIPQGYDKTFAEMDSEEKDMISMRTLAVKALSRELRKLGIK